MHVHRDVASEHRSQRRGELGGAVPVCCRSGRRCEEVVDVDAERGCERRERLEARRVLCRLDRAQRSRHHADLGRQRGLCHARMKTESTQVRRQAPKRKSFRGVHCTRKMTRSNHSATPSRPVAGPVRGDDAKLASADRMPERRGRAVRRPWLRVETAAPRTAFRDRAGGASEPTRETARVAAAARYHASRRRDGGQRRNRAQSRRGRCRRASRGRAAGRACARPGCRRPRGGWARVTSGALPQCREGARARAAPLRIDCDRSRHEGRHRARADLGLDDDRSSSTSFARAVTRVSTAPCAADGCANVHGEWMHVRSLGRVLFLPGGIMAGPREASRSR